MIAVNFKVVSLLLQEHLAKHAGDKPYKFSVEETQRVGQTVFTGICPLHYLYKVLYFLYLV